MSFTRLGYRQFGSDGAGAPGADGSDGADGPQGATGAQGPTGLQGPTGSVSETFPDGTEGNPSITFTNDTTTGLRRTPAGNLGLSVIGTNSVSFRGVDTVFYSEVVCNNDLKVVGGDTIIAGGINVSSPGLSFLFDNDTGLYNAGFTNPNVLTVVAGGTASANFGSSLITLEKDTQINASLNVNGSIQVDDGSAGSPSITFGSDSNLGIYRSGTDELSVTTGGTQRATFGTSVDINAPVTCDRITVGDGSLSVPGINFESDTDLGIYRSNTDEISISAGGTQRALFGSDTVIFGTLTTDNISAYSTISTSNGDQNSPSFTFAGANNVGLFYKSNGVGFAAGTAEIAEITSSNARFNEVVVVQNGTASAPSIAWFGDNNTGFVHDTDEISISTGGTDRVTVNNTNTTFSSGILVADGSTGAPSISFTSDTNLGIYRSGADQLSISTGGTQRASFGTTVDINAPVTCDRITVGDGSLSVPAINFESDTDLGIYRSNTDEISISTGGSQRAAFGSDTIIYGTLNTDQLQIDGTTLNEDVGGNLDIDNTVSANGILVDNGSAVSPSISFKNNNTSGLSYEAGLTGVSINTAGTTSAVFTPNSVLLNRPTVFINNTALQGNGFVTLQLPTTAGPTGAFMMTDGSGALSFEQVNPTVTCVQTTPQSLPHGSIDRVQFTGTNTNDDTGIYTVTTGASSKITVLQTGTYLITARYYFDSPGSGVTYTGNNLYIFEGSDQIHLRLTYGTASANQIQSLNCSVVRRVTTPNTEYSVFVFQVNTSFFTQSINPAISRGEGFFSITKLS